MLLASNNGDGLLTPRILVVFLGHGILVVPKAFSSQELYT